MGKITIHSLRSGHARPIIFRHCTAYASFSANNGRAVTTMWVITYSLGDTFLYLCCVKQNATAAEIEKYALRSDLTQIHYF